MFLTECNSFHTHDFFKLSEYSGIWSPAVIQKELKKINKSKAENCPQGIIWRANKELIYICRRFTQFWLHGNIKYTKFACFQTLRFIYIFTFCLGLLASVIT